MGYTNEKLAAVIREAAAWRVKITDDRPLLLPEAWRFLLWAMRSPSHIREYLRISRLDDQLARKLGAKCKASTAPRLSSWTSSVLRPSKSRDQRYRSGWNIATAAAVLAPMVVFLVLARVGGNGPTEATVSASSESDALGDGVQMFPDPGAKWKVRYTDERREVNLRAGGALFDVNREFKRPLIVTTMLVEIAAVDARFAVRIDRTVEVEVYRGVVEVSERGAKPGAPVIKVTPGKPYQVPLFAGHSLAAASSDWGQFQGSEWMVGRRGAGDAYHEGGLPSACFASEWQSTAEPKLRKELLGQLISGPISQRENLS